MPAGYVKRIAKSLEFRDKTFLENLHQIAFRAHNFAPDAACFSSSTTNPTSIEGTTWTGLGTSGEYAITFLKDGRLKHSVNGIQNGQPHTFVSPGDWKQSGKNLVFTVNSYTTWTGKFQDGVIRGTASNTEGAEFKFLLAPKQ